jgi:hypothetical protein
LADTMRRAGDDVVFSDPRQIALFSDGGPLHG